jgi:hypothetical protein
MSFTALRRLIVIAAPIVLVSAGSPAFAAPDLGKRACAQEAKRLCPAEMRSFSRGRVERCMIAKIAQTSPICHAAMLRIKAEREAAPRNQAVGAAGRSSSAMP